MESENKVLSCTALVLFFLWVAMAIVVALGN